jgi:hypothetical protein
MSIRYLTSPRAPRIVGTGHSELRLKDPLHAYSKFARPHPAIGHVALLTKCEFD